MKNKSISKTFFYFELILLSIVPQCVLSQDKRGYEDLVDLFKEWRSFEMRTFFDKLNSVGNIPISLGRWEMTGVTSFLGQE